MTAATVTLARVLLVLAFVLLAVFCLWLAVFLGFTGYLFFLLGLHKFALACWAASCCSLVLLGIAGAFLPAWLSPGAPAASQPDRIPSYRTSRGGV
jgi:hypothetical protein